jgi:hypothetical protein
MIEHHVPLVVGVCDYVSVLNFGRLLAKGEPDYVKRHPEVVAAYLGSEAEELDTEVSYSTEESDRDAEGEAPRTPSDQTQRLRPAASADGSEGAREDADVHS